RAECRSTPKVLTLELDPELEMARVAVREPEPAPVAQGLAMEQVVTELAAAAIPAAEVIRLAEAVTVRVTVAGMEAIPDTTAGTAFHLAAPASSLSAITWEAEVLSATNSIPIR